MERTLLQGRAPKERLSKMRLSLSIRMHLARCRYLEQTSRESSSLRARFGTTPQTKPPISGRKSRRPSAPKRITVSERLRNGTGTRDGDHRWSMHPRAWSVCASGRRGTVRDGSERMRGLSEEASSLSSWSSSPRTRFLLVRCQDMQRGGRPKSPPQALPIMQLSM